MSEFFYAMLKPGIVYDRWIPRSVHITSVAIDKGDFAKIYLLKKSQKYIVATLSQVIPQATLNLKFSKLEQIIFVAEGNATVSILGYWNDVKHKNILEDIANQNKKGMKAGALACDKTDDNEVDGVEEGGKEEVVELPKGHAPKILRKTTDKKNGKGKKSVRFHIDA